MQWDHRHCSRPPWIAEKYGRGAHVVLFCPVFSFQLADRHSHTMQEQNQRSALQRRGQWGRVESVSDPYSRAAVYNWLLMRCMHGCLNTLRAVQ